MKKNQRENLSIQDIVRMAESERISVQKEINANRLSIDRSCFKKTDKEREVISEVKKEQNAKFANQRIALITT